MTAPVLAPPPVLIEPDTGARWVYAGMTDLGPAYMPQQPAMPLHDPAPVDLPWQTVTARVVQFEGE